jgi:hypothetical protein
MAIQKIMLDVEMMTGEVHENIRPILADMIRYSDVSQRHKWRSMEDDPIRAGAFLAYAAMTRTGLYDAGRGFDEFTNDVAMVYADFGDSPESMETQTPGV